MERRQLERRDFLKQMGCLLLGIICSPFAQLFGEKKKVAASHHVREAMHYTSGDHLTG